MITAREMIKKETVAAPIPPKISPGQWTPEKTLDTDTILLTTIKATANGILNNNTGKDNPKKNAV